MLYTLKQTGTSYAIDRYGKLYNAGNDITLAMEVLGKLNKSFRANVEQRLDGLYVCWGDGSCKSDGCNYVKVISYDTQTSNNTVLTDTVTWPPPDVTISNPLKPIETTAVPPLPWSSIPATDITGEVKIIHDTDPITWNPSPSSPFTPIPIATPCVPWYPSDMFPNPPWNPSPSTPFNPVPPVVPQPVTGWVCPKCGNGVSPYTPVCPCNHKVTITC